MALSSSSKVAIDNLYLTVLGRAADTSGEGYWSAQMDSLISAGLPATNAAASVASSLAASTEALTYITPLYSLYKTFLGRVPDAIGLQYWENQLHNGTSLKAVANAFATSSEFGGLISLSPDSNTIISNFYLYGLGRPSDASGYNYWVGQANKGVTIADIGLAIATAPEALSPTTTAGINAATFLSTVGDSANTASIVSGAFTALTAATLTPALTAAIASATQPAAKTVVIKGPFADTSTLDLQAGTVTTGALKPAPLMDPTGKAIGAASVASIHTFDLSGTSFKKAFKILGTKYDDVITVPSGGATVEAMAGNDTLLLPSDSTTTIVLGARPPLLGGNASPYDNGLDTIGAYDSNGTLTGSFKLAGKSSTGDILDLHNFLGQTGKLITAVDLDAANAAKAAVVAPLTYKAPIDLSKGNNGDVMVIETQHPSTLALADLNTCFILPVPTSVTMNAQLNYVALAISHNASSDAYIYGIQHLGNSATFSAAAGDQISVLVKLVGVTTAFAGAASTQGFFTQANIL